MLAFTIMDKDEPCMKVAVDESEQVRVYDIQKDVIYLPGFLYEPGMDMEMLSHFFESRSVPRTRVNIDDLLEKNGLPFYHPLSIVKITHGVLTDDFIWLKFEGEDLTYDDIKIR